MSRSGKVTKRNSLPDPVYDSRLVTHLVNRVMRDGKKSVARRLVYSAFEKIEKEAGKKPVEVFQQALENIKPAMEVRSRRIGGAAYQIPVSVRGDRRESLAIRWLVRAARARSSKSYHSFDLKLSAEILDASKGEGAAVSRKNEIHRMADANKAFAHFRW